MRYQAYTRRNNLDSAPLIVDEDHGIPTKLIEEYPSHSEGGIIGPADPRAILLSMSDHSKARNYNPLEYIPATRPDQATDYASFDPAPTQYGTGYLVSTHAQQASSVPPSIGLPYLPPTFHGYGEGPHDHASYYPAGQPSVYAASSSTYSEAEVRQLPDVLSITPARGPQGTRVSIHFQSIYDLQSPPKATVVVMFGHKRCDSVISRTSHSSSPHQYIIQAEAPSPVTTGATTLSSQVPLALAFAGPALWQSERLEIGSFTYADEFSTPVAGSRKRKLSPDADDQNPSTKKQLAVPSSVLPIQSHYTPDIAPIPPLPPTQRAVAGLRRYSQPEYGYIQGLPRVQTQQIYTGGPVSATARLQTEQSPAYGYHQGLPGSIRSPIATVIPATRTAQLLSSSASGTPQLIRTSTIQQSPSTPGIPHSTTQSFNPYAMYPANSKAMLKLEGDLGSMVEGWTEAEWEAKRRLVQFQRSQQGSIISTTFEATTPADRLPNSICVSCIWWEEKAECYVTSVDTIQLLESLVAVRFTVEEKNRIRRNLEGFRPATVSKTKADSEDFFKLIMNFPAPKPRNIEKDVKVFPWRILSTALKKIIGKYSASYSSTAGALHNTPTASNYLAARMPDVGAFAASPRSTSSSSTMHGHSYATAANNAHSFLTHTTPRPIDMSTGPPELRLTQQQAMAAWQEAALPSSTMASTTPVGRALWDYSGGLEGYGITTGSAQGQYHFGSVRIPAQVAPVSEARFVPLQDYEQHGQPTSAPP